MCRKENCPQSQTCRKLNGRKLCCCQIFFRQRKDRYLFKIKIFYNSLQNEIIIELDHWQQICFLSTIMTHIIIDPETTQPTTDADLGSGTPSDLDRRLTSLLRAAVLRFRMPGVRRVRGWFEKFDRSSKCGRIGNGCGTLLGYQGCSEGKG